MDWVQGCFGQDSFHVPNTLTACPTLHEEVSVLPPVWSGNSKLILTVVRVSAPRWWDSLWQASQALPLALPDAVTQWNVSRRMASTHIPPCARFYAGLAPGQGCPTIFQKKKQFQDGHEGKHCMVKTLTTEEGELGLIPTANSADECSEWQIPTL